MERRQSCVSGAQAVNRRCEVVGDEIGVAFIRAPDLVDGLADTLSQLRPDVLRLRPVVGQGEIELQDLGGKRLDGDVLARIHAVGGPDEKAEDESGQQGEETRDRADHVLPAAGHVFLGQKAVQDETERPSSQHDDAHCERELLRIHDIGALGSARLGQGQAQEAGTEKADVSGANLSRAVRSIAYALARASPPVRDGGSAEPSGHGSWGGFSGVGPC